MGLVMPIAFPVAPGIAQLENDELAFALLVVALADWDPSEDEKESELWFDDAPWAPESVEFRPAA